MNWMLVPTSADTPSYSSSAVLSAYNNYTIKNQKTNNCLDSTNVGSSNTAVNSCNGGVNQLWQARQGTTTQTSTAFFMFSVGYGGSGACAVRPQLCRSRRDIDAPASLRRPQASAWTFLTSTTSTATRLACTTASGALRSCGTRRCPRRRPPRQRPPRGPTLLQRARTPTAWITARAMLRGRARGPLR